MYSILCNMKDMYKVCVKLKRLNWLKNEEDTCPLCPLFVVDERFYFF